MLYYKDYYKLKLHYTKINTTTNLQLLMKAELWQDSFRLPRLHELAALYTDSIESRLSDQTIYSVKVRSRATVGLRDYTHTESRPGCLRKLYLVHQKY